MSIRWMYPEDFDEVVAIDECGGGVADKRQLHECLSIPGVKGVVWCSPQIIRGFTLYQVRPKSIALFYMMVGVNDRRAGIGREFVSWVKIIGSSMGLNVKVQVRESDTASQLFFKSQGFTAYKVKRRFFHDTGEDAYLFRYVTTTKKVQVKV